MIPAPAQGAMMVVALENNKLAIEASSQLNHNTTAMAVQVEREFLRKLEGGCTAPIGALATIDEDTVTFKGALFSLDGKEKIEVSKTCPLNEVKDLGIRCAVEILNKGGTQLMENIKNEISSLN